MDGGGGAEHVAAAAAQARLGPCINGCAAQSTSELRRAPADLQTNARYDAALRRCPPPFLTRTRAQRRRRRVWYGGGRRRVSYGGGVYQAQRATAGWPRGVGIGAGIAAARSWI